HEVLAHGVDDVGPSQTGIHRRIHEGKHYPRHQVCLEPLHRTVGEWHYSRERQPSELNDQELLQNQGDEVVRQRDSGQSEHHRAFVPPAAFLHSTDHASCHAGEQPQHRCANCDGHRHRQSFENPMQYVLIGLERIPDARGAAMDSGRTRSVIPTDEYCRTEREELREERLMEPQLVPDRPDPLRGAGLTADTSGRIRRELEEDHKSEEHNQQHDDESSKQSFHKIERHQSPPAQSFCRLSPSTVNDNTVRKRNMPGIAKNIGSLEYHDTAEAIICPQEGSGGVMPTPRKDNPASVAMNVGTANVAMTTIVPDRYGRTSLNTSRTHTAPEVLPASTNSRFFNDRV